MNCDLEMCVISLSMDGIGGPAHGIVTKTVHKTLPGGGGVQRVGELVVLSRGGWVTVVGDRWVGVKGV